MQSHRYVVLQYVVTDVTHSVVTDIVQHDNTWVKIENQVRIVKCGSDVTRLCCH